MTKIVDLSNYATKVDLKGVTGTDTSTLASETYLASLKTKVYNLDVVKLKIAPAYSSNLSNEVLSKRLCMINWLSKLMLLILRYQVLVD